MSKVENRLRELGLELPIPMTPVASYVGANIVDGFIYVSGQIPIVNGTLKYEGKAGKDVTIDDAYKAAEICALRVLSEIKKVVGDLDNIDKIVKLDGYVNSAEDFYEQSKVINGASDLFIALFGENGKHARKAIGVAALPSNAVVEVELIASLKKL